MPTERFQLLITPEQRRRLEAEARAQGISISAVVREAIDARLPRFSREERIRAARAIGELRGEIDPDVDVDRLIDEARLEGLLEELPDLRQ